MPKRAIYSKKDLLALLLNAGLLGGFAEGTSNALEGLPDADTLLGYIKTLKHDDLVGLFDRQVEKNFGLLAENGLLSRPVPVAIDWFDWMFYGDPESAEMVTGTNRKKGSNYAYEFLTASIVAEGKRLVVAVLPLGSRAEVLSQTVKLIQKLRKSLKIGYLTFDGGFFCIDLLRFLEQAAIKYIMHMPQTKQTKRKRLWHGRRFRYTTSRHNRGKNKQASFDVVVAIANGEKNDPYLFATNFQYDNAIRLLNMFRHRWGIETSYRINNQFLPKTTSKVYAVRLFYYLFACLMQNCWVLCKTSFSGVPVLVLKLCLLGGTIVVLPPISSKGAT